jgi:2,4-dienoyl-CoA reductase-like NADH-dependent reductase (Old Yellow Enzyme family)
MIAEMKEMKLWEFYDRGLIHSATRLVVPPMATQSGDDGFPGARTVGHYTRLAANSGVGLLFTEHSYIVLQGKADPWQLGFETDDVVPYQRRLTEAVHKVHPGILFFAQISHTGVNTSEAVTGEELVSASVLAGEGGISRALTIPEIRELEGKFADAALRVKASGYDGVEIHSAHGYLLNQFYSPLTNDRHDEYGVDSIRNRTRFLIETVVAVRKAVGRDFPIAVRLGGSDYMEGGSTVEDGAAASALLEQAGVDLIDLSGGLCIYMRPGHREAGWFSDMSRAVKEGVRTPVILTGGVRTPQEAEALLKEGAADFIGVGRAMLQNPAWGLHK